MKLYYFEAPNPRKACAVAKHLELPVDYVCVDLSAQAQQGDDYLAINRNGKVPTFVDEAVTVTESAEIMMHLADAAQSDLWPWSVKAQAQVLKWLTWDVAHFSRHAGTLFFEEVSLNRPTTSVRPTRVHR